MHRASHLFTLLPLLPLAHLLGSPPFNTTFFCWNGSCYNLLTASGTWDSARAVCQGAFGDLVSYEMQAEQWRVERYYYTQVGGREWQALAGRLAGHHFLVARSNAPPVPWVAR
jgi:hypothetical protein